MTVRDAVMELWDLSGHMPELYPFQNDTQSTGTIDINAEGTQYFLRLLTQGQLALANWKKLDQRFLRFRQFYKHFNIKLGVDEDVYFDITRESATEFNLDPTQANFDFDLETLESSIVLLDGSKYKIMSILEVSPTNWTFFMYPDVPETTDVVYPEALSDVQFAINEFDITSSDSPPTTTHQVVIPEDTYTIFRIDDYEGNSEVEKAINVEELGSKGEAFNTGVPQKFLYLGDKIIFDTALAEQRWYKIEIFRQPATLTDLDQGFEIPPPYHQALVFWGMWKISMRERNEINSMNFRRLVDKELLSMRDEYDQLFERTKTFGVRVRRDR